MINPYAQSFMIATRTEHLVTPVVRDVPASAPRKRFLRLFRLERAMDLTKI